MQHDLIVIGGGPAGYVGAIRAAQLGLNVACVDKNAALGGTCLRVGCIPSKALLESSQHYHDAKHSFAAHGVEVEKLKLNLTAMLERKNQIVKKLTGGINSLLKHHKIKVYTGTGRIDGPGKVTVQGEKESETHTAKHILIASGSVPAKLQGVEFDGNRIGDSTTALSYSEVPAEMIVIGAGYIGLELGSVWSRLGAKVTVLEYLPRIMPGADTEMATLAQKIFEKQGIKFQLGAKVEKAAVDGARCSVKCEGTDPIQADRVLVATGRVPCTEGLGLESVGIKLDERGRIPVDMTTYATTAANVYAVGDCIGGAMLAHKASDEAVACVEKLVTGYGAVNYDVIPSVAYTHPELASVGKTEQQLQEANHAYRKGTFPFKANGRAITLGDDEGLVKVLSDEKTDRVLGVHILGPRAGDLIAEAGAAMAFGASSEDIARVCHAHPTLAEAVREASLAVAKRSLHV